MRKVLPVTLVLLALAGIVTVFALRNQNEAAVQVHSSSNTQATSGFATTWPAGKMVQNPYVYYTLKQTTGFVLARAFKGAKGQPIGQATVVSPFTSGFGQEESDNVTIMQLSPDGLYLAINGSRDHGEQVWMFDTQRLTMNLTPDHLMGNFLRWMPGLNGHTFLYRPMLPLGPQAPIDGNSWNPGMWLVNAATGQHINLDIRMPSAFLIDAAPSPDGARIIYSTSPGMGMGSDTWIMNSDGTGITHLFSITGSGQSIPGLFAWSPDGKQIAYERIADSPTPFLPAGLWLMDPSGRQQQQLAEVDGGHGYAPIWSPDGQKLAFVIRTNESSRLADENAQALQSGIAVVNVATRSYSTVAQQQQTGMPLNINPQWSADGASITFVASNPVNLVTGATPRYWSVSLTPVGPQISVNGGGQAPAPSVMPLTPLLPHVFAIN